MRDDKTNPPWTVDRTPAEVRQQILNVLHWISVPQLGPTVLEIGDVDELLDRCEKAARIVDMCDR